MGNTKEIFQAIQRLLFLCFAIELIVQSHVSARLLPQFDLKNETFPYSFPSAAVFKSTSKVFEPLLIKFPDTTRTGAAAKKYKENLLNTLGLRARKEDKNIKMTGESCARGLGHLYEV